MQNRGPKTIATINFKGGVGKTTVLPNRSQMPVQAINGWCPEMWLPACVGCGSRKDEHPPTETPFTLVELD